MHSKRNNLILFSTFIGLFLIFILVFNFAAAQGTNLLSNPSFEGQYSSYVPETAQEVADCPRNICTTAQVPSGWKPWWVKERPTDVNPEFKPAEASAPGNRVLDGSRAAQYFSFWSTHKAGLRQTVPVAAGSTVEFSIFGQAWMSEADDSLVSDYSGTPNMRIGIDPTGGNNVYSPSIVWSDFLQPYDQYQRFSVTAQAQADAVTVFTYSAPSVNPNSPEYGFKHTDVYWDNAALVVVGAGAAPPPPPPPPTDSGGGDDGGSEAAAVAVVPFVPGPTATPNADGVIMTEVQAGDSLWALSARAGITLDELLELNEMGRDDIISPGDLLIVGFGDPPEEEAAAEEAAAEEPAAEGAEGEEAAAEEAALEETESEVESGGSTQSAETESALLAPTPTPGNTDEIASAEIVGASICLEAYNDPNQNGIRDQGEELRSAVAFTISDGQSVVSNYVTDGESEPFCIKGLDEGSYRVTRSVRPDEIVTTPGDHAVSLADASTMRLSFGSYMSSPPASLDSAVGSEESANLDESGDNAAAPDDADGMSGLIIGAVVVALLLLVAVIVVILTSRRSAAKSSSEVK